MLHSTLALGVTPGTHSANSLRHFAPHHACEESEQNLRVRDHHAHAGSPQPQYPRSFTNRPQTSHSKSHSSPTGLREVTDSDTGSGWGVPVSVLTPQPPPRRRERS
jgi:hypothetical protein